MGLSTKTWLETTTKDAVKGLDPYTAKENTPQNQIPEPTKSKSGMVGGLSGNKKYDLAAEYKLYKGYDKDFYSTKNILKRVGQSMKIDTSFLKNTQLPHAAKVLKAVGLIDESTANFISGKDSSMTILDIYNKGKAGYEVTVKNGKKILNGEMWTSFSAFSEAIASVSPELAASINALGLGEEFAVMQSVVTQAAKFNIPGLIDEIISDIKDHRQKKKVLAASVPDAISSGNIDVINAYIKQFGSWSLLSQYPDLIMDFLANYHDSDTETSDKQKADKLISFLNSISTNWYKILSNGIWVPNILIFLNANANVKNYIMASQVPELVTLVLANYNSSFKEEEALTVARRYYKYV